MQLVGVGTHLDLEESEVVAFKNGPWTFLCGMHRKSHISYSQVSRERKPGMGSCFSWSSDGHTSIRTCVQSPVFMLKKKKKPDEALCLCKASSEGSRLGQKNIQAGWAAKPASQ